ncbi:hypothetical protein TTHERM_00194230 (macronuclear) [Tetrahymena thermophila SB210]|uniref:Uncharacterized protein n=1 Tax=Tetrahymena thermophila (strain SB210) TaxID=312017 RepID=Q23KB2_TETTS|nr:hypothetical protein TTHERM_00194230 [Tetrahymena thermophila SB210]EAR96931.2 hypothetical protein TTHERM_00194230 [Tetrahymena thermophila SB210]|eukprot:XP_001017176.2 hypothetical protein TTHERM_00194230 [Tetrahymena thermophila SB210]
MDLLSEEEKQLIKFFEKKVQNESNINQSDSRQRLGQTNDDQLIRENESRNQNSFQRYSQMFGNIQNENQENLEQNSKNRNQYVNLYENQENDAKNEQRFQIYYKQPQKNLNAVIFNGDDNSSNHAENNSNNTRTNSSFNSSQHNKQYYNNHRQGPAQKQQLAQQYLNQPSNDQIFYSHYLQNNTSLQNSKNVLENYKSQQGDLNTFTFKPPTSIKSKDKQKKVNQDIIVKNEDKKFKNSSKKDFSVKKNKQLGDQQTSQKKVNNNSDKKQMQKINTSRPQSSRNQQKSIKNNSFVNQQEHQISSNKVNKTPSQMQKNKSLILGQEQNSKMNAKKDEILIKNNSLYKQSSNKKSDSKLKKARSTSLFVSNLVNQSNLIQKDCSKDKLESVRKRSNSKSKKKLSIVNTQSNKQLKSERSRISSYSYTKGIPNQNDVDQIENKPMSNQEVYRQFLDVLEQNHEESERIMLKVIENHINDCKEFKQKIVNIIREQINYNRYKSQNSQSNRGNDQI